MGADCLQGTIAGAVLRGQAAQLELRSGEGLRSAATALITAAEGSGCSWLVPTGVDAAALTAGAVLLSNGQVRTATAGEVRLSTNKAMVVESVAVSGAQVRRQVRALRQAGCDWVGAFVWKVIPSGRGEPQWGDVDLLVVPSAT